MMKSRPLWEVLVGSTRTLDYLAGEPVEQVEHPWQKLIEEFIETLNEGEKELFYLRYGEQTPIREIAKRMGYQSHQVIQIKLTRIEEKARKYIERKIAEGYPYRSL